MVVAVVFGFLVLVGLLRQANPHLLFKETIAAVVLTITASIGSDKTTAAIVCF